MKDLMKAVSMFLFFIMAGIQAADAADMEPGAEFPRLFTLSQLKYWYELHPETFTPNYIPVFEDFKLLGVTGASDIPAWTAWSSNEWVFDAMGADSIQLVKEAGKRGIYLFVSIPFLEFRKDSKIKSGGEDHLCVNGKTRKKNKPCIHSPLVMAELKKIIDKVIARYGQLPAIKGIYIDEPAEQGGYCERCIRLYREYLKKNFTPEELKKHNVTSLETVVPPFPDDFASNPFLRATHHEFRMQGLADILAQIKDYIHQKSPSDRELKLFSIFSPYSAPHEISFSSAGSSVDIVGADPYNLTGKPEEGYLYELLESVNPGNVYGWEALHQMRAPEELLRGIYTTCLHASGVGLFAYRDLFLSLVDNQFDRKYITYNPDKNKDRLDAVKRGFGDIIKIEPWLAGSRNISPNGIIFSDEKQKEGIDAYLMLQKAHIPVRCIFKDRLSKEVLAGFNLLILTGGELSDSQINVLEEWVKSGGILITSAGSSMSDKYGVTRKDFGLSNVFGCSFKEKVFSANAILKTGSKSLSYYQNESISPVTLRFLKKKSFFYLESVKLKPGANAIAEWQDIGLPAIVSNRYGKGLSIHFTHSSPWLLRTKTEWVEFWGNVINQAKVKQKIKPVLVSVGIPSTVEISIRVKETGNSRYHLIQLLNFGDTARTIEGVKLKLSLDKPDSIQKIFSPLDNVDIAWNKAKKEINFTVPAFRIYKPIVIISKIK